MIVRLATTLILLGSFDDPPTNLDQLRVLVHTANAPLKSIVLVYEGEMRWVGDPKIVAGDTRSFEKQLQGTFLYRNDGAELFDAYEGNPAGVIRWKGSFLKGRQEETQAILDSKQEVGDDNIRVAELDPASNDPLRFFASTAAPNDLFPTWLMERTLSIADRETSLEGWEQVGSRNCLKIRSRDTSDANDKESDTRIFWLDLERNAQVLKVECFGHGQLLHRFDEVILAELPLGEGRHLWHPIHTRHQYFQRADLISKTPLFESTIAVVNGSIRANLNLPDALFTVKRNSAWPSQGELGGIENATKSGSLYRKFQSQPPPQPYATDPISVAKRIEENLDEADRQSKELEASSPSRRFWNGQTLLQAAFALLSLGILASVIVWKRRRG